MRFLTVLTTLAIAAGILFFGPLAGFPDGRGVSWANPGENDNDGNKDEGPAVKPMMPEEKALRARLALAQKKTWAANYNQAIR